MTDQSRMRETQEAAAAKDAAREKAMEAFRRVLAGKPATEGERLLLEAIRQEGFEADGFRLVPRRFIRVEPRRP